MDLTPVLEAYARGYFPMGDPPSGEVYWLCPDPRTVIPLDAFRPSEAARRKLRQGRFPATFDRDFPGVLEACADREPTWIVPALKSLYHALHRDGHAHSAETWMGGALAGGLYGLAVGRAFIAESMFHRVTDAGMVALAALAARLRERGFELLDVQFPTEHLRRCGAVDLPRREFLKRLRRAASAPAAW